MVQYGVRRLTDAMRQMTNVERIIQFAELEPVSLIIHHTLKCLKKNNLLTLFK